MVYGFQLLGLLLTFLLLMVYYNRKDNFMKGNYIYKFILLVTYLAQLASSILYILLESGNSAYGISGVYLFLVLLWFALYGFYYITVWIKNSSSNGNNKNLISRVSVLYWVVSLIGGVMTLLVPVRVVGGNIDYGASVVSYFMGIYLIVELLVLIFSYKNIFKQDCGNMVAMFLVQGLTFLLQIRSPEIPFLIIGMILVVYYCYFMIENPYKRDYEDVVLERDYAKSQSIDKSSFLKVLSHEIRTPLNAIDGFSQVIMDSDNVDEIKSDAKDIRMASRELMDVINGMIDLSIIESGKLEILEDHYNVYDMFDNIKNIAMAKMRDKLVDFEFVVSDDIPEVLLGDSERISQVMLNLIMNAIKYTDKGKIVFDVSSVRSSSKCRLRMVVSDTGRGIKSSDMGGIFEGKSSKDGYTLGLAISKYLLELMGGNIEVESTYGVGSKFIVTLDQKIVSDKSEGKISKRRVLKPFKASDKRILLVDDNKLNLKVASKMLAPYGVDIVEVTSGRECLDILDKDNNFDLILMDDLMPEMSGSECLDILKKLERVDGYYIPVVVLTANAVNGMKEKYLNVGFDDYLAKPIDKYELDRILKKYLKGKNN